MIEASEAWMAVSRFGLGPRPGELRPIRSDPRGYVLEQLERPEEAQIRSPELRGSPALREDLRSYRERKSELLATIRECRGKAPAEVSQALEDLEDEFGRLRRNTFLLELEVRAAHAVGTRYPFLERLVLFWSNHFAIAPTPEYVRLVAGVYEREAIRPHVLGRFLKMLRAAVLHPAMLHYLDNYKSFGPDSTLGRRRGLDINENLGREVLELHTLGVDGGYTQEDVIELAYGLTGWTGGMSDIENNLYNHRMHQPGRRHLLGREYDAAGEKQTYRMLRDLSGHPSTADHIARKLVRHFVSEQASPRLSARLARTFVDTNGDLGEVARVLVVSDEAWQAPAVKIVPPYDFVVAAMRACGRGLDGSLLDRGMMALGQAIWDPPSPAGWSDDDSSWSGGDALLERLDWATAFLAQRGVEGNPVALGEALFGSDLDDETRTAVARAETREQGQTLLLMSPYFLRR